MSVDMPMFITLYGLAGFAAAILAYFVASAKHRDASQWAAWSFLFPPAVIMTFFLTTAPAEQRAATAIEDRLKKHLDFD